MFLTFASRMRQLVLTTSISANVPRTRRERIQSLIEVDRPPESANLTLQEELHRYEPPEPIDVLDEQNAFGLRPRRHECKQSIDPWTPLLLAGVVVREDELERNMETEFARELVESGHLTGEPGSVLFRLTVRGDSDVRKAAARRVVLTEA